MNKPIISIIIPVYNVALFLRQCIQSIISQEGNIEVILVDDGSPDESPSICDEYAQKDNRIHVIHKQNGGVSSARNAGLDTAQGEWIWFVDGDDYIAENVLKRIYQEIQKHPHADLIQMGMNYLYDDHKIVPQEIEGIDNLDKNRFLLQHISYHNPRILFKREIIEQNRFHFTQGLKVAEDQEFQLKYMMLCKTPIQIPISAYIYRQREGSATHDTSTSSRIVNDTFTVLENLNQFINEKQISTEEWLHNRIQIMIRSLLYAASQIHNLDKKEIKAKLNRLAIQYEQCGINCFKSNKIMLARKNLTLYFLLNKYYLKIKGIK